MTRAAEKLHISQPSVSQAIRELEEHYGTRLFERLGKKLFLTAAGEELLQYAIILLGFEMNLFRVLDIGSQSFSVMIFTLLTAFMTAWGVGRLLHLDRNTTTLIGAGTGI
ncbi:putative LysR family transcriptional regulator (plasmid) [Selenomonas ruminantium subsp. lactilytica TAM6421]|uniref:Putative LysR family transcriptional regulator n=1 Tax=Selenomonas ruminantium subsp. lactilytica (strain NBRC 103574 / TAM6421) TaxID=927704 RepID=I0GVP5_SELRL|nr:putative LysR family transcriptional regulator [Selenomonas ruminantium subsp. lactilytica TAM6421]